MFFFKLNIKFNKFKKEQTERTEMIEQKKLEFEKEMKDFSERKFSLEKSKLLSKYLAHLRSRIVEQSFVGQ